MRLATTIAVWGGVAVATFGSGPARADLILDETNYIIGTIGAYDVTTGTTVSTALVSALAGPEGIALSGGNLFVVNNQSGTVGEYNATTGEAVNTHLVGGLSNPTAIAIAGGDLFVANSNTSTVNENTGTITEYNATTGMALNPFTPLISGLNDPTAIAVSSNGEDLYVATAPTPGNTFGTISEYTIAGTLVNSALISALGDPTAIAVSSNGGVDDLFVATTTSGSGIIGEYAVPTAPVPVPAALIKEFNVEAGGLKGIAVSGGNLFFASGFTGSIGEYDVTTGDPVNLQLITGPGLVEPFDIVLQTTPTAVPEPASMAILGSGLVGIGLVRRRRKANRGTTKGAAQPD